MPACFLEVSAKIMNALRDVLYQLEQGVLALTGEGTLHKKLLRCYFEVLVDIAPAALPQALQPSLKALQDSFSAPLSRPLAQWHDDELQALLKRILGFYHQLSEHAYQD